MAFRVEAKGKGVKLRPSFLSLPTEIRQQILLYTYDDDPIRQSLQRIKSGTPLHLRGPLHLPFRSNHPLSRDARLAQACRLINRELARIQDWTHLLRDVDVAVQDDVPFVVKTWVGEIMGIVDEQKAKFGNEGGSWGMLARVAQTDDEAELEHTLHVLMGVVRDGGD
ncbi:hypothetical protein BLS_007982 [Venturia inaequalis]|uniref:Uncharacterized protein n=1 Tax=Venturia inaequalis TaxID=5025 RepID=A0A8H3U8Q8_VENIN|nr:hypothetical protein BLS_007982 [Venturia inaequalis]KAE9984247.1 hypothetical protein EG327_005076 [Venturia inaequalis]RDI86703.1 DNA repair protein [Venturia inaequalis]